MSKMMPTITSKLRRKKPLVTVESPSGKEPDPKESKGIVKAATGLLRTAVRAPPPAPPPALDAPGMRTSSLPHARRSSVDRANLPPELNAYMKGKVPKAEPSTYLELLRFLGELRGAGEKGQRQLLVSILPRLAQMENLPASLIPHLLQVLSTGRDRRLSRYVHYLLQTTLGPGSAGAPSATPGPPQNGAVDIGKDVASKAWPSVQDPIVDSRTADNELRTLSAAARGSEGKHDKELAQAVLAALERAAASPLQGPASVKRAGRKSPGAETLDPQWSALSAARAGLRGKALREAATKGMDGILSQEPTVARHALALALHLAQHNSPQLLEAQKDLTTVVAATCGMYEASGYMVGSDSKKAAPSKLQSLQATINGADKWARVYLARLCSAILYAEWASTQEFARGQGKPFWTMLVLLATRDKEDLVVVEAIKALFGSLPSASGALFAAPSVPEEGRKEVRRKARAWKLVSHEAKQALPAVPGTQSSESATLMGAIGTSIRRGLLSGSSPLVSAACRAAGAMLESRAHAGPGSSEAESVASTLQLALGDALQGDMGPVERSHALSALIWAQGPDAASGAVARHVTSVRAAEDEGSPRVWPADLLQSLVSTCHSALRALPAASPNLLATVNALAAVSPTVVSANALFGMWAAAQAQGSAGTSAAFQAALQLLSSQQPTQNALANASPAEIAAQAAEDAAWTELQRCSAWWLGEFVNSAAGVTAGHRPPETSEDEQAAEDTAGLSAAEILAMKALRKPLVAATVSHLQHACLTSPWIVRVASAQALAKVAVRSNEPYRLQCYGFLSAVASIGGLGLAALVGPALDVLDRLYSSQMVLEKLACQHGDLPNKWPPAVAQQLRQRHNALARSIEKHVCSLSDDCYPIGARSMDILSSGLERLAPGQELPTPHQPAARLAERRSSGLGNRVDSDIDSDEELSLDGSSQQPGTARSLPTSPILNGSDALADLTRDLDDRLRMDALKQREPSPFQHTTFDTEPSYSYDEEPSGYSPQRAEAEQPAFEFMEREADWEVPQHGRTSSADKVHYVNGPGEVLHAFDAEAGEELSVYAGEEVEVVAEVDGWLHCVASNGAKGLVPSSYVRLLGAGDMAGLQQQPSSAIPSQPSFDPLSGPDPLAAFTQAREPSNSWMSFDDEDATSAGPFHQGSMASNMDAKSMDATSGQEEWSTRFETDFGETAAEASTAAADHGRAPVPELTLQDIDAAIDREMASPQGGGQSPAGQAAFAEAGQTQPPPAQPSSASSRDSENQARSLGRLSSPREQLASPGSRTPRSGFSGPPGTPGRQGGGGSMDFGGAQVAAPRSSSFADAAGSPRRTPRHSRNSSVEALASAAAFVQPYKASILYGFEAETEDELSVAPGDEVTVQVEVEGWVQITRDRDGKKGLVPASYLQPA